jgi:hypothetical protein
LRPAVQVVFTLLVFFQETVPVQMGERERGDLPQDIKQVRELTMGELAVAVAVADIIM